MDAYSYKSMEQCLIEEVRKRPEIYDKTTAAYRTPRIREQAWRDVAQAINISDVEVVKKRWGTLRDSFIKIQRTLKHNPKQVVKWLYHKQFKFLIPHVESKVKLADESLTSGSDETLGLDASPGGFEADSGSNHQFVREDIADVSFRGLRRKKRSLEDPLAVEFQMKKSRDDCDEGKFVVVREVDADEQFLLSCLPALKRLRPRDNAIARIRIQQVLFDVEFGEEEQKGGILVTKIEVDGD